MALTLLAKRVHSMPSAPARMAAETVTRICKQHKRNSHPKFLGGGYDDLEEIVLH